MILNRRPSPRPHDLQALLARDHRALAELLERVSSAFRADARRDAGPLWTELDSRLRTHMALEEQLIIPAFARFAPSEARTLRDEHARIRDLLVTLDLGVDLHLTREREIEELAALLRSHAEREEALMYRWAAKELPAPVRRTLAARLGRALEKAPGAARTEA